MTTQKEPREFWIDEGWNGLDLGWYDRYVSEFPEAGSTEKPNIIHVIEHSAYLQMKEQRDKAVTALKEIYADGSYEDIAAQIATEALKELGELKDGVSCE